MECVSRGPSVKTCLKLAKQKKKLSKQLNRKLQRVGEETHYEQVGEYWVVYRSRDRKVLKSINYFRPNLKQFFTDEELKQNS